MDAIAPADPIGAFALALGRSELSAEERAFAEQALADTPASDLPEVGPEDFAGLLARFWTFAATRDGAAAAIRLEPATGADGAPLGLDALEIVQADTPFLVDSVMGELTARGLEIRAMAHPVVPVSRDAKGRRKPGAEGARESMILVLLAPVGEDRRPAVVEGLAETLADVHAAVEDFGAMAALMRETIEGLAAAPADLHPWGVDEEIAFLEWLTSDRFVFLGARVYAYPRDRSGRYIREEPTYDPKAGLGVLRDPARSVLRRASEPAFLADDPDRFLRRAPALTVAKSNLRARVHRRAHMDYIGVRRYGPDGAPTGEVRFLGLFTAEAYEEPARALPILRRKIEAVLAGAGHFESEHAERRLRHIVETYPRDDLWQIDEATLTGAALGIMHLYDRPRVRLFVWRDVFDRFLSILLFVPRECYHAETARRAGDILARAWDGRVSAWHPRFADEPLARIHVVIGLAPGVHPNPDLRALEREIAEALRTWSDRFEAAVRDQGGAVVETLARWSAAFPPGYRDRYDAAEALRDADEVEALLAGPETYRVRPYKAEGDSEIQLRIKLYVKDRPAPLSDVLPLVEHMLLKGMDEVGFEVSPAGAEAPVFIHDYLVEDLQDEPIDLAAVGEPFRDTLLAVLTGRTEDDGFNRLVLELGVSWREAALVRALARWRQQTGLDPGQMVQETALSNYPGIGRLILDMFRIKFDPGVLAPVEDRRKQVEAVYAEIEAALQKVESLDDDRVLRRMAQAVRAMTRTNYFLAGEDGQPRPYLSFKIASQEVEVLPAPRPYREIFVAGGRVDGVHLRFGPVARGGLRWSDRRDDFRTEVLALVRTQHVKNAVIVPAGAKGGFYPKRLPREGGPDAVRAEAVEAYKIFLAGLLDLTDNLDGEGAIVRPAEVLAYEPDDPYLVVAADKGTASFSDIANGVAEAYGFWLGDAFASGGSHGYDHKAMGITARGAWESAKRHFRELGKDIQSEPFTCVGVGDMSGDVFGNGMLLSKATRLVAAFDHRHVFIDPDPDMAKAWAERQRLFDLPRSSWADYDESLISKGGGVFPRSAKTVELSPEARAVLGIEAESLAPADLVSAVLRAPVEMLYLGGIGTYVKAPAESHAEVADKANDPVRIDAPELRCKVVVEGANLGFTQAGRIAYARAGGRINTDAIDNSAGVDTSDHEVNIKILTGQAIASGKLKAKDRDPLLVEMTDAVAEHVLAHNYAQTLALTLAEADAAEEIDAHAHFMTELVSAGRLDRRVEGLPGPVAIAELKSRGQGLTRPELAVLLAYAKLELSAELTAGAAPDDPYFEAALVGYFPRQLAPFEAQMRRHRLRREIISTVLANAMVDMGGPTFASRLKAATGCDAAAAAAAFEASRQIFRLDRLWGEVAALDLKIPAAGQARLFQAIASHLRAESFWLVLQEVEPGAPPPSVRGLIKTFRPVVDALATVGMEVLSPFDRAWVERRRVGFVKAGAPEPLAEAIAGLSTVRLAIEIARLTAADGWSPVAAARLYHAVGAAFGFDRVRGAASALPAPDDFERRAVRQLIVQLVEEQTALALEVQKETGPTETAKAAAQAIAAWTEPRKAAVDQARRAIAEIEEAGDGWTFAKLTLAHGALRGVGG